jgi:hypothetical protein
MFDHGGLATLALERSRTNIKRHFVCAAAVMAVLS